MSDKELAAIRRWMAGEQPQALGDRHMDVSWIAHRLLDEVGKQRGVLAQVVDLLANSADHDDILDVLTEQGWTYEWAVGLFADERETDDE